VASPAQEKGRNTLFVEWVVALIVLVFVLFIIPRAIPLKRITVLEYQQGLRYSCGRYSGTLHREGRFASLISMPTIWANGPK
jgi:hypothetical protein